MRATSLPSGLRWVDAGNAGPFTLEGTRCHIVGRRRVAIIDPGPADERHVDAIAATVRDADRIVLLLTHGHGDHSGAVPALARRLGAPTLGAWEVGERVGEGGGSSTGGPPPGLGLRALSDGDRIATDAGDLVAVQTPGHSREHLAFHWPEQRAVFVGDLVLGSGETTWVGGYPRCVSEYLDSLDRVERLGPRVLLPAHGPPIADAAERIERFRAHRRARIAQVERALADAPDATADELLPVVYGAAVPGALLPAARASLSALVEHVRERTES